VSRDGTPSAALLRVLLVACACLLALAAAVAHAQGPAGPSVEYAVKATYLYKFAPFVEWPPDVLRGSDPLVICIVGRDAVADLADEAMQGQAAAGHPIRVVRLQGDARDPQCNILYVAVRGAAAAAILDAVRGRPVLTVTDGEKEPGATGIVNFVVIDNRVRFEIDQRAAAENHLVISSKLLSLASRVTPKP
jgi:hypothetical protein